MTHEYSIEEDLEETKKCLKETQQELQRKDNIINKTKQYIKENILSFNEVDMMDIKVILDMLEDE